MDIKPGDKVQLMELGEWQPAIYEVTFGKGRTDAHLVLRGPSGLFECYNDAPYNMRKVEE